MLSRVPLTINKSAMSNPVVGYHKLKHLLDLLVILHLSAMEGYSETFTPSPFEDRSIVSELAFGRITAEIDSHDDFGMFLAKLRE